MSFKPGDIVFIRHYDNPISKIMAWFMGDWPSHSAIVYQETNLETYLIETSDFQVVIGDMKKYLNKKECRIAVYRITDLMEPERELIASAARLRVGGLYGYLQLLSLGVRRLIMKATSDKVRIKNFIRQGEVCTAVPLYGLTECDIPGLHGIDPESMDTVELLDICRSLKRSDGEYVFECVFLKSRGI